ncbi:MAG TPA: hypothetical protein VFA26_01495 [Gemmataceae bacterium]|nr:hypothetical protein [Gemmataceae bacterium]
MNWSAPVSREEAIRRARGRARYNRQRKEAAKARRKELAALLRRYRLGLGELLGTGVFLARLLGVSPTTVGRDLKQIRAERQKRSDAARRGMRRQHVEHDGLTGDDQQGGQPPAQ